jgi:hypothetical protein
MQVFEELQGHWLNIIKSGGDFGYATHKLLPKQLMQVFE